MAHNAGGNHNNEFRGGDGNDIIYADDGHDKLVGGSGNDTLVGGSGDDYMLGGTGDDLYHYESGNDTISEVGGGGYILNIPHEEPDIRRFSNWQDPDYITGAPEELLNFCSESDLVWLRSVWESEPFKNFVGKYRSLQVQVSKEGVGPKRNFLLDELRGLTER